VRHVIASQCSHLAGGHYDLTVGGRRDTGKVAPEPEPMRGDEIGRHLRQVGQYLHAAGLTGEIMTVRGAYMTLVRAAREQWLPVDWLNDAVKGFLNAQPETTTPWAEFPGLGVYAPDPAYIFAMKALAGRPADQRACGRCVACLGSLAPPTPWRS